MFCFHSDERDMLLSLSRQISRLNHNLNYKFQLLMSKVSDFASAVQAHLDRQDTAITALQGDVANLEAQIAALQNSTGEISAADQALLDGIQSRVSQISDKLDALDALTPPVAPTP